MSIANLPLPDPRQLPSQSCPGAPADLPFASLDSPAEVLDLRFLEANLAYLHDLSQATGTKILMAQKAFSLYQTYPLIHQYLCGFCSSGLYEAKLAHETVPEAEIHVFSPAYKESEICELIGFVDYLLFNSPGEWWRWRDLALEAQAARSKDKPLNLGLRINPEYSQVAEEIYNPAAAGSRLGTTHGELEKALDRDPEFLRGLNGLHFHALCEEGASALEAVLQVFETNFSPYFSGLDWLNFGGGHHLTRADYEVSLLASLIQRWQQKYSLQIYLEPGEAVALDCGWLLTRVLDTPYNQMYLAILDASAACHMPDVLEMPYRPRCLKLHKDARQELAGLPGEKAYTYRLGGATCLAGDIIGDYSFEAPLQRGDLLVFGDMSIYSHVKRNSFNGMPQVDLYSYAGGESCQLLRHFDYTDFKNKLGS